MDSRKTKIRSHERGAILQSLLADTFGGGDGQPGTWTSRDRRMACRHGWAEMIK
jgi:hypothetical protein